MAKTKMRIKNTYEWYNKVCAEWYGKKHVREKQEERIDDDDEDLYRQGRS